MQIRVFGFQLMRARKMTNNNVKINRAMSTFWVPSALFVFLCICITKANVVPSQQQIYEIPAPKFKLLKPKGFQVTIPDENGIQLFAFHGNLNKKMEEMATGQFSKDIIQKQNGKWIYQNQKLKVKPGDIFYFWIFVVKSGVGYRLDDGYYEITDADLYRSSKKQHKLRKRGVVWPDDVPSPEYYENFNRHYVPNSDSRLGSGTGRNKPYHSWHSHSNNNDDDEQPFAFGYSYGHGMPHHHQRGHEHNHGHGPYDFHAHHRPSGQQYGHHGSHNWGHHHHDNNCNHNHNSWSGAESSDESNNSNEFDVTTTSKGKSQETTEKSEPSVEVEADVSKSSDSNTSSGSSTEVTQLPDVITASRVDLTTEELAEVMPTTTTSDAPNIDLRFGDNKDQKN